LLFQISSYTGFVGLVLLGFCTFFFRNPERTCPQSVGAILATGDGVISNISRSAAPKELEMGEAEYNKISIFLNVFNVHVNRVPVAGKIVKQKYIAGKFLNASLDKASEDNERNIMAVENSAGETIIFTQIAGLVARRIIVSEKKIDENVEQGERYGIIRFGSRCDIYVPLHYDLLVTKGQIAIGGETILAVNKATFSLEDLNWKKL
jgi:phosphatidylserine decarboxylase